MSFNKINKRKSAILLHQLEESLGEYVLNENPRIEELPKGTVNAILKRSQISENTTKIEDLLEATYLDEIFHFILEITKNTSTYQYIIDLMEQFKIFNIFTIRNIIAHPNKIFLDEYWYRIALIASSPIIEIIGLTNVKEALMTVENGTLNDPPEEWLEEITHSIVKNNLPKYFEHSITGLVGRQNEEKELNKLLVNPRINTIGVVASGGIGKTALVLDVLNNLVLDPNTLKWCESIIFLDMKTEKLTSKGIENLKALETIKEIEFCLIQEINSIYNDSINDLNELFKKYQEHKILIFIDNLETLIRDNANSFEEFNLSLPREWRLLITSRISISSASIVSLKTLNKKSALQLAIKYTSKSGQSILSNDIYNQIIEYCYNNPLAIRLTLDLYISGMELPTSMSKSSSLIAEFSFKNLIDQISENSIKVLEALYIVPNIDRIRLCELLKLAQDDIAECIFELSRTSLVSRISENDTEVFNLSSSVRHLILGSPRNLQIRSQIQEQLQEIKIISDKIEKTQDINNLNELDERFIPSNINDNLKLLVNNLNNSFVSKGKIERNMASKILKEFTDAEDIYKNEYFFHRSFGRLYTGVNAHDKSLLKYKKSIELNNKDCLSKKLLADIFFYSHKDFNSAEKLYRKIIDNGKYTKNGKFAKVVLTQYFNSLLYQDKHDTVLDYTTNWSQSKNIITKGVLGAFRGSAWKRKTENMEKNNSEYFKCITNSIQTFDEVFSSVGYIIVAINQVMKIIEHIENNIDMNELEVNKKIIWLNFIEKHLLNITKSNNRLDDSYIDNLVSKLSKIIIEDNPFNSSKWDSFKKKLFCNSITENNASTKGLLISEIRNIPNNQQYKHSSFLFVQEYKNKENSYLVHSSSMLENTWDEWKMLKVGMKLAIKPSLDEQGRPKSDETYIIEEYK